MTSESQINLPQHGAEALDSRPSTFQNGLPCAISPPFSLEYFAPDDDLKEFISTFYIAHINVPLFDEYERADRPQFRFMDCPNGSYIFADGQSFPAHQANIIGPTSGRVRAVQHGPSHVFGFGLLPAGWAAFMGDDADKLTDRSIDAADIFGPWICNIADALEQAADNDAKLAIGNTLVRDILSHAERAPMWFIRTVDHWLTSAPSPQISDLVAAAGMSLRSIERMTKIYYGHSPRMLARKYRALRAANLLARGESLETGDLSSGFYDQSHLIREVKHFAGATPSQLRSASTYVVAAVRGRKNLAGKVPTIVSET